MTFLPLEVPVAALDDWRLVIDTSTRRTVVAIGRGRDLVTADVVDAPDRHGASLMSRLARVLAEAGVGMDDIGTIGVSTGPGSFTGLRVGLATAKTLAALRHLVLVSLPTDRALRRAAGLHLGTDLEGAVVILPAGARDHYLALPDADPILVPPDLDLLPIIGTRPVVAVDVDASGSWFALVRDAVTANGHPDPLELGRAAIEAMPRALIELLGDLLERGEGADPATIVPRYVALPRGIAAATAAAADDVDASPGVEGTWSPGSR